MTRESFIRILRGASSDVLDSLDMRPRPARIPLQPDQIAQETWSAVGGYLREAMERYEKSTPRPRRSRS